MAHIGAAGSGSNAAALKVAGRTVAVVLGAVAAIAGRDTMNHDGVSYLDLADAYLRGDWGAALSGYWSPLYAWILAVAMGLAAPTPRWEYTLVHVVNFAIYLLALACFEVLIKEFIASYRERVSVDAVPHWVWWACGYSLFVSVALTLITIRVVTPDMGLAAAVFMASALLLRIQRGDASLATWVCFGGLLGLSYLAKGAMFLVSFSFLASSLWSPGPLSRRLRHASAACLAFACVAAPLVVSLSIAKGRLTFGDTGRIAYAVYVNGQELVRPTGGTLRHPLRTSLESPRVFEYGAPIAATYAPWYDPSYWHEGERVRLDLGDQIRASATTLAALCRLFLDPWAQLNWTAGVLLLFATAPPSSRRAGRVVALLPSVVPAAAAAGLYMLVYLEPRYLAPFLPLVWLSVVSCLRWPTSEGARTTAAIVIAAIAATSTAAALSVSVWPPRADYRSTPEYWQAAEALLRRGVAHGDRVAAITDRTVGVGGAFVARLSRTPIVAELEGSRAFATATPVRRGEIIAALLQPGVRAILARGEPPPSVPAVRWTRLGETSYYVYVR
jgi:hypothetical protein